MPEMAEFCGQRFHFDRTANRVCEEKTGEIRGMEDAIFLQDLRCDGSAHDGCQRGCLIIWKTAWLKAPGRPSSDRPLAVAPPIGSLSDLKTKSEDRYYCQSTELASATQRMSSWDPRPLISDLLNREISLGMLLRVVWITLYNKFLTVVTGQGISRLRGTARKATRGDLGLEAGDCVIVKNREEIMATVNEEGQNRGLSFEFDMLQYCGGTHEVAYPIRKIILEETGRMIELSNSVVLDGVVCEGLLRRYCPRQNHVYWREAWLTRCADSVESRRPGEADPGG